MRLIAVALLAALLLPAAAVMTINAGGACCCASGAGATCPMKRSAAACTTSTRFTCDVRRTAPAATLLPTLVIGPATLTEAVAALVDRNPASLDLPGFRFATRGRRAPDAPPPKRA